MNRKKAKRNPVQELKGTRSTIAVKEYFYRQCPDEGWRIYTIALNKKWVYNNLQSSLGKKKLYNFLARFVLQKVDLSSPGNAVTLVIDKSKNKDEIADFNGYVANQLEALLPLEVSLNIYHECSHENAGFYRPWMSSVEEFLENMNAMTMNDIGYSGQRSLMKQSTCR